MRCRKHSRRKAQPASRFLGLNNFSGDCRSLKKATEVLRKIFFGNLMALTKKRGGRDRWRSYRCAFGKNEEQPEHDGFFATHGARRAIELRQNSRYRAKMQIQRVLSAGSRSEEHTSELQSRGHLVCRLLLEKK